MADPRRVLISNFNVEVVALPPTPGTATAADIKYGKKAWVDGELVTGTAFPPAVATNAFTIMTSYADAELRDAGYFTVWDYHRGLDFINVTAYGQYCHRYGETLHFEGDVRVIGDGLTRIEVSVFDDSEINETQTFNFDAVSGEWVHISLDAAFPLFPESAPWPYYCDYTYVTFGIVGRFSSEGDFSDVMELANLFVSRAGIEFDYSDTLVELDYLSDDYDAAPYEVVASAMERISPLPVALREPPVE